MKKIIVALSLVALVGAGCANTPSQNETKPTQEAPTINLNQDGTQTIQTDSGASASIKVEPVKPSTPPQTQTTSDEDVPVTDVFLGTPNQKVTMDINNFSFKPNTLSVKAGEAVQITFKNVQGTHTFNLDETDSHYTITQGSDITIIAPKKPGSYKFYCSIGDHRTKGMEGTMIVK